MSMRAGSSRLISSLHLSSLQAPRASWRRGFSSGIPPPPPAGRSYLRPLAVSFATGFTGAVIYAIGKDYVKNDGAPGLELMDSHGEPWTPAEAIELDDPRNPMRVRMSAWVKNLQEHIVSTIETIEASQPPRANDPSPRTSPPPKFKRDAWIRPNAGGEGSSCILSGGRVFEKAGVNISIINSKMPPAAQKQMRADHSSLPVEDRPVPYFVAGLSIVLHPWNPHVPTVHLNYRYFEVENPDKPGEVSAWWFGGGSDLTPSYLVEKDVRHFHKTLKDASDKHDTRYWKTFKPWCDKYFYVTHRKESRGVGGFFFDDLTASSDIHKPKAGQPAPTPEDIFGFVQSMSSAFLPSYIPIVLRNKDKGCTDQERRWQLLRRGRYVEFNLLHDRGTKFGLATPAARVESILMSLPETARWEYMCPLGEPGTPEGDLLEVLRNPKDWA